MRWWLREDQLMCRSMLSKNRYFGPIRLGATLRRALTPECLANVIWLWTFEPHGAPRNRNSDLILRPLARAKVPFSGVDRHAETQSIWIQGGVVLGRVNFCAACFKRSRKITGRCRPLNSDIQGPILLSKHKAAPEGGFSARGHGLECASLGTHHSTGCSASTPAHALADGRSWHSCEQECVASSRACRVLRVCPE